MKKSISIIFIFIFQFTFLSILSADTNLKTIEDSLILRIDSKKNPTKKVDDYISLIKFLQSNNFEKALRYCDSSIALCQKHHLKEKEIEIKIEKGRTLIYAGLYDESSDLIHTIELELASLNNNSLTGNVYLLKNLAYIRVGDLTKAMDNGLKAIIYLRKANNNYGLTVAYNNIGTIYDQTNNNQKALEYYLKGKEYGESINNLELLAMLDNNIGVIYDRLNNSEKALKYYYKSLEYNNEIGNLRGISTSFNNIASTLSEINRNEEAMVYYKKALKISTEIKNRASIALLKYNIGYLYYDSYSMDSAEFYFNESLKLSTEAKDSYSLAEVYNTLGMLYFDQNKLTQAINTLKKSIDYANQSGVLLLKENNLKILGEIYASKNDFKTAYSYQNEAIAVADSIRELNKIEELRHSDFQIEFQNQSGKFDKDLKEHEALYQLELNRQKNEKYIFVLLLILIIIITVVVYKNFKKSSNVNKKLVKKNREVEDQKELIEISNVELREQYAFTETLLNTIPNPVFYTDRNSQILGCNKAFEEVTGKVIDELIGVNINKLPLINNDACNDTSIFRNSKKELVRNEGVFIFNDGAEHDVICYRKGIIDAKEKLMGILGIIIDITDIKAAEKNLKYSQSRLKEVISAKDKFFNIMAHDLKNPFNAVLGLTSLIANDYGNQTEAELKQYIGLINNSSTQIYSLLENLLEWARAQSGFIEKNPTTFLLNEIILECLNLFSHSIEQKNIKLITDTLHEIEVFADKNMIMTILRNLLSNAVKFTNEGGTIKIEITKLNNIIRVSVIDDGVGIIPENKNRLFRIDQPISTPGVDKEKGTGLGLIICQEFINQNGGTLEVTSEPNVGSNFSFTIPTE